ncbi:DUF2798 domain-containing protein [Acinetobacter indicus]|jgi:Protein of unknown function (DUF2798).|uniref:DUF2798 domain-containing protein n=1 Tax=Acinetobacter indicus TaxID=756892 RepID=UPI00136401AE|nr:DUF2798 domain-containing protein [Acinetobacter indicus]
MTKLSLEGVLIPFFVSFFMSGINAILGALNEDKVLLSVIFSEWMINWIIAYPCLLIIVPFSRMVVLKVLYPQSK